jgi:hypothetical protein
MADRYWVGGTAAWDGTAGTKWALTSGGAGGQAVPTSADDVFFSNLSTGTCTISTGNTGAKSINCTGHLGTIAGTAAISVAGSVTFVATQTVTYSGTLTLTATGTLTTDGKTLGPVTVNAVGGTVTLGSALTSGDLTVTSGTFSTSASNYAVTASALLSENSNTRTISLNGSTVTLSNNISSNLLNFSSTGTLTFNAGTSTIVCSNNSSSFFTGASKTFNNVSFTGTGSIGSCRIFGANTFNTLTFTAPASAGGNREVTFSGNQTITTLVASGVDITRRILLSSNTPGTARTLTVTTWATISDVDFQSITMNSSRSGTRLGNCGGNTNITFDAAKTVYWNLAGTQNWTSNGWATTSGGAPSTANFPLAQDTAVFDNTGSAGTVAIDATIIIGTLDSAARTSAMTLSFVAPIVYGNWTTGTGVTLSGSSFNSVNFRKIGTQTITSAGKTFGGVTSVVATSIVLADALISTGSLSPSGTFNSGTYSVTSATAFLAGSVTFTSSTLTLTGTGSVFQDFSSTGNWGSSEIIFSNTTTTARTFNGSQIGGSKTYGKLTIGGATGVSTLTIAGTSTFSEIASTKTVAHTIVFPNVITTTGAWTVAGSSGNLVTLARTGASGTFTLAKSGGDQVSSDFLSISNSTATPGSTWYAGDNSINGGNNSGWTFTVPPPPSLSSGNFFQFFV